MKVAAFWDDAQCSLVEIYRRFRGTSHSEMLVSFDETTRGNIPEGS
jgi:hypothetical protein